LKEGFFEVVSEVWKKEIGRYPNAKVAKQD
jgi:hypothetical protein